MEKPHSLARLWRLIQTEKTEIRNIYVFSIFQGLVSLSLPLGIQAIINLLQSGQLRSSWVVLVIFVLLGILFYGILQIKQMSITESIEQKLFVRSSFDLAFRLPKISIEAIRGKYVPELMNRFFDVMTVQKGISKLLIDFSASVVQILFGLILLSFYHPLFILLGVVLVLLLIVIFRITGPIGLKSSLQESSYKYAVAHWLEEVSRTLMTFKLAGKSKLPLQKNDAFTSGYLDARQKHFRILLIQYKVLIVFKLIVAATLIIAGSILVVDGKINIGQFVAAEIIIILLINSVEKIILNMSTVYDVLTALEKVGSLIDIPLERQDGTEFSPTESNPAISVECKNIRLQFADSGSPILNNLTFKIEKGQRLCISGNAGSGKTTLLKLIAGFYTKYDGNILINDIPLSNLNLESLRENIGENFTEQEIFHGSIQENILCGNNKLELKDAMHAAKIVGLEDFISELKNGYDTQLKPGGIHLSSSTIRKIVLARCIASKPGLLLIEDNLTSLANKEKEQIINSIFDTCKAMTIIVCSNNPDIQKRCNAQLQLNS